MKEEFSEIFDKDFARKLKSFYSFDEKFRRTGRTSLLARILLETAIETGREISLVDHYIDNRGIKSVSLEVKNEIHKWKEWYRSKGVDVRFEFKGTASFKAWRMGNAFDTRPNGDGYDSFKVEYPLTPDQCFSLDEIRERLKQLKFEEILLIT